MCQIKRLDFSLICFIVIPNWGNYSLYGKYRGGQRCAALLVNTGLKDI